MPQNHTDDRSAVARAGALASSVITICLEMVVPVLLGYWIDQRLRTVAVFAILGAGLGMWLGMAGLIRLARPTPNGGKRRPPAVRPGDDDGPEELDPR